MPNKVAILPYLTHLTPECLAVGACNTIFFTPVPSLSPSSTPSPSSSPSSPSPSSLSSSPSESNKSNNPKRILSGTNTDVIGVRDAFLLTSNPTPIAPSLYRSRPALVLGSGGAARSAVYALRTWLDVGTIYLVNRDKSEVDAVISWCVERGYGDGIVHLGSVREAERVLSFSSSSSSCLRDGEEEGTKGQEGEEGEEEDEGETKGIGAIVACIPDLPPVTEGEKTAREIFEVVLRKGAARPGAMLEMCYNPRPWTALAELADGYGWRVILGTEAMIWQGLEQDRYWTGRGVGELPVAEVQRFVEGKLHGGKKGGDGRL